MIKKVISLSSIAVFTTLVLNSCGDDVSKYREKSRSNISNSPTPTNPRGGGVVSNNPHPFKPIENPSGVINQPNNNGTIPSDTNNTTVIKTILGTYSVKITPEYESITAGQTQNIHYEIVNFFTKKPADDSVVKYIKFDIDKKHAEFFDPIGRHGDEIEFKNPKAIGDIAIKSTNLSGQVPINFNAVIDNTDINLTKTLPVVIEKNRSSSMAIVPFQVDYDPSTGLFTQTFTIHVVDSYGNKAKDGTRISTGVINNPKLYSSPFNSLHKKPGTLKKSDSTFKISDGNLSANVVDKITDQDTLIVLANKNQHKPANLGGWDIASILSDKSLKLYDLDKGKDVSGVSKDVSGVSYVIGDEYRYDECSGTIMNAAAATFNSTEVKDGIAQATLRYTPDMFGRNVFIYANSVIDGKKIGISRPLVLTGLGLEPMTVSLKNDSNVTAPMESIRVRLVEKGSKKFPRHVYIGTPVMSGSELNYAYAKASKTDCDGWTTVSIYGIKPGKTAAVTVGEVINYEPEWR